MSDSSVTTVNGSELPGTIQSSGTAADLSEIITFSIFLRDSDPDSDPLTIATQSEFQAAHSASQADIDEIVKFAQACGLDVILTSAVKRLVKLKGMLDNVARAFALEFFSSDSGRTYSGSITIPGNLKEIITGVIGLDNQTKAEIKHIIVDYLEEESAKKAYSPAAIAEHYNFPADADGAGQTIGIIELGGNYSKSELMTYFNEMGVAEPEVVSVYIDENDSELSSADSEVLLDIEVAGMVASGARFVIYFASNTKQGFLDAIKSAIHDTTYSVDVLSISWAFTETDLESQFIDNVNAAFKEAAKMGITVCTSSGDRGAYNGGSSLSVQYPASDANVLTCGGTQFVEDDSGNIIGEEVWQQGSSATGGGISVCVAQPSYQGDAGIPLNPDEKTGRGLPDVAGFAATSPGYKVYYDGGWHAMGGTSAVAPLWAALIARINQSLGKRVGFINETLYCCKDSVCNDITVGNNGYYDAGKGWDACTGWGTPDGTRLLEKLKG